MMWRLLSVLALAWACLTPGAAQPVELRIKAEVDGRTVALPRRVEARDPSGLIRQGLTVGQGSFVIPESLKQVSDVSLRLTIAGREMIFEAIPTGKLQGTLTFGIDTKPFDADNASSSAVLRVKPSEVWFILFSPPGGPETRLVVPVSDETLKKSKKAARLAGGN